MSYSLVSASVSANAYVTTFNSTGKHKKNATADDAVKIGNLLQECVSVSISAEASATAAVMTTAMTTNGGLVKLTTNIYDSRFELINSEGTVVASNMGTEEQLAAFQEWKSGTLSVDAGAYTITATPAAVVRGEAAPEGDGGVFVITQEENQGTTLSVNSRLTGNNKEEYYDYYFSGKNMKLDFSITSKDHNTARVVVYNSSGSIVADSQGTSYQRTKYTELTSSAGMAAETDNYSVKVTYGKTANSTKDLSYDLQLYSGDSYTVIYKSKISANDYDGTAAGSVTETDDAQLYETTAYNKIGATAMQAINIGWMQKDKSMLAVYSELTSANNEEFYSFTLQEGDNLKFGFKKSATSNADALRVQILNSTGTFVIADNEGTAEQKKAYKELTTANGMESKPGTYVVKISYTQKAIRENVQYQFGVYSGTSYYAQYKTTASAQTYENAMLNGTLGGSKSRASAIASYMSTWYNGDDQSSAVTRALQSYI